ncbi:Sec1 family domain-containing protein 1 [Amphibalanus amphitrite]|uniref:Sec1 family domain-containing protein 1 n=1 Tax=Amphibalanus amphitrite TaxID=1232801 RepID=A0A6A4W8V8_AMPAM|nr:sec1 family domain-containing protein 1-like isoform X2 [Amphibalanus amphitrite]XP_043233711.1 sec1 family domain-containing protein 1-like [Amphibalanus amphitrite]KAF0299382.1 Sec1 family domain-containing protein 1 [Amphibalanus amphitrite]
MAASLREKQVVAIKKILNLNAPLVNSSTTEPVWKVLVYDKYGQDVISPVLAVKELRDLGVTLHMPLHAVRNTVPDAPAIYLCVPSDDNLRRICQDLADNVYDSYYFNFLAPISRQKLELLATAALQANCAASIKKVFDQYVHFISLEKDMFVLRHHDNETTSYYALNRGDVKDTEMDVMINSMVDSLFAVCVTLGTVPIIRCPRNNAAEMVAERLDRRLRENVRDARSSLFSGETLAGGQYAFQRPLLVVLDRNMDLATPLHHTWTYQALAHDVLDLRLNRVTVEETVGEDERRQTKTKTFDLAPTDEFWQQHKGSPFPMVAEAVQEELDKYRASEGEVKQLKHAMGLDGESDEAISLLSDNTAKLTSAVSSLPELLERKRLIDAHTTIATAILEHIKRRKLDAYFETEEKLLSRAAPERPLVELLRDPEMGSAADALRLFLMHYVSAEEVSSTELEQCVQALSERGADLSAVQFAKRWRMYNRMPTSANQYLGGGTKTVNMFSKLMSQGSQFVMEGVKNLVVKKHNLPVTRIVDALMEQKSLPEVEEFRYLDPKLLRPPGSEAQGARSRNTFQEAVVFVVGGGNYIEYQNLVDYTKSKTGTATKRVIYGCSDLQNASQFLKQLGQLGTEMQ